MSDYFGEVNSEGRFPYVPEVLCALKLQNLYPGQIVFPTLEENITVGPDNRLFVVEGSELDEQALDPDVLGDEQRIGIMRIDRIVGDREFHGYLVDLTPVSAGAIPRLNAHHGLGEMLVAAGKDVAGFSDSKSMTLWAALGIIYRDYNVEVKDQASSVAVEGEAAVPDASAGAKPSKVLFDEDGRPYVLCYDGPVELLADAEVLSKDVAERLAQEGQTKEAAEESVAASEVVDAAKPQ